MSAAAQARGPQGPLASLNLTDLAIRLIIIGIADACALLLGVAVIGDGNWFLGLTIIITAVILSYVNLRPSLWPVRWMTPALGLVALLVIYPMAYTLYVAFTNYSDGHRYTKIEAIEMMGRTLYLPEGEASFEWEVFRDEAGTYALWLSADDGQQFFAIPDQALAAVTGAVPSAYEGYTHLEGGERFRALSEIQEMQFGPADNPIGIASRTQAGVFRKKWEFDAAQNAIVDRETDTPYFADDSTGQFAAVDGATAPLGYWVAVGLGNFTRIFTSSVISGPLALVFAWTIAFSLLSVISSFALGLLIALILNKGFRGVRIVRSLLLIPYAIPGMISILIWRGMLNPNYGVITTNLQAIFGWAPSWNSDPGWAKVAILLVNLWLAFPYFMLICSGALQAIPTSIYEAAEVDGANRFQQFWKMTMPLLLVAVGPLLVASFTYNFNNFLIIEAMFGGGPPMIGTSAPPVGHTDNLISYTFRYAFSAGGTRDYGFASAIAIVIFLIVGALTLFQFRFTRRLEEIGENV